MSSEPRATALSPIPSDLGAVDWKGLFALDGRESDDREVLEKLLEAWTNRHGVGSAGLFVSSDHGHKLLARHGDAGLVNEAGPVGNRGADLQRLDLPQGCIWHDAAGKIDPGDPSHLLLAAAAQISKLKRHLQEHRFQVALRGVELEALYEVGLAIASTLDLEKLGEALLLNAMSLLDARRAALYLTNGGTYRLFSEFGAAARPELTTAEVEALLREDHSCCPEPIVGSKHLLAVPIEIDRQKRGLLVVADKESRRGVGPFQAKDRRSLLLFANQAAIALENAKLHKLALEKERLEREMQLAAEIQNQILPKSTPRIAGYTVAGWNKPARQVGGDYYGFLKLDTGQLGLVVGDVTGKGMPAALLVSTFHSALLLLLDRVEPGPELAERLNRHIFESSSVNKFITALLAWLDSSSGRLTYLNAGHNPGVLLRKNGGVELLSASGVPLGLLPMARYATAAVEIEPGDLVCLYSDGITECEASDDEQFGLDRLIDQLRAEDWEDLPGILRRIDERMIEFAQGRPQGDDQTVVLLRRDPA
jgi:phosphoserine phosphatase RsbU/P